MFKERQGVLRHKFLDSDFPIAQAVEVPSGFATIYLSGVVAPVVDPVSQAHSPLACGGDTERQTVGVIESLQETLHGLKLTLSDVVKMQVYLVADRKKGGIDFNGFMSGYRRYFGTEDQPNLPARSTFEVAGLASPGLLIEIEVIAVRKGDQLTT